MQQFLIELYILRFNYTTKEQKKKFKIDKIPRKYIVSSQIFYPFTLQNLILLIFKTGNKMFVQKGPNIYPQVQLKTQVDLIKMELI